MRPFPPSFGNLYMLVGVYYVSKWVEAVTCKRNDHKVVLKFLKENIFSRFGTPKSIINDGGFHFYNRPFINLLPIELEHHAYWAIKKINFDFDQVGTE